MHNTISFASKVQFTVVLRHCIASCAAAKRKRKCLDFRRSECTAESTSDSGRT